MSCFNADGCVDWNISREDRLLVDIRTSAHLPRRLRSKIHHQIAHHVESMRQVMQTLRYLEKSIISIHDQQIPDVIQEHVHKQ